MVEKRVNNEAVRLYVYKKPEFIEADNGRGVEHQLGGLLGEAHEIFRSRNMLCHAFCHWVTKRSKTLTDEIPMDVHI